MSFSLSHFSIRTQILAGYIPVLAVLAFLAFSNFQSFKKFDESFSTLQDITQENLIFLEIERDIIELQRNVLVYSYVGYEGVLRKIEFLQKQLEEKLSVVKTIVSQDEEIKERFDRMIGHYDNYKLGFNGAIQEKNQLKKLNTESMNPLIDKAQAQLNQIKNTFLEQGNFKNAYEISQIERDLFESSTNIKAFSTSPDSLLINNTRRLISNIQKKTIALNNTLTDSTTSNNLDDFLKTLKEYKSIFANIIRINRNYLNLVHVVLPGKAAEIDVLSNELDSLIAERSHDLKLDIKSNINSSQKQFITLSLFAGLIGILSSIWIAMGIAKPVSKMATTLSELTTGNVDTEIPGQDRKDEVGKMAKAANGFKLMAIDLKNQTAELEEFAYRTSHDLRSPLVSSIGLLDISFNAIDMNENEKARKSLLLVKSSLIKLEILVKDILELTKTKNLQEDRQEINFETVVNESLQKLSNMENFRRLKIKKDLNYNDKLFSQKSRIELIIGNLISNSIKYQDIKKQDSFVKISTYEHNDNIVFDIEDNGLGIAEHQRENVFQMFKRFHTKVSYGSGLGLYMIKKSADIIGGSVIYEPKEDGSIFKFIIPKTTNNSGAKDED